MTVFVRNNVGISENFSLIYTLIYTLRKYIKRVNNLRAYEKLYCVLSTFLSYRQMKK